MLHQLLGKPIDYLRSRYVASPRAIFRLVAAAENVDLYDDFTGILVIDGVQKAITADCGSYRVIAVERFAVLNFHPSFLNWQVLAPGNFVNPVPGARNSIVDCLK